MLGGVHSPYGRGGIVKDQQLPEGKLIENAQRRTGLSARKASRAAEMSDTRWRNIVNGYQAIGRGEIIPVVAPADTLARMAYIAGVSAQELADVGRQDAHDALLNLEAGTNTSFNERLSARNLLDGTPREGERDALRGGIRALIESKRAGRTIASLSDACGGDPTPRRLQQIIAAGIKAFPDPNTINGLARGLGVSVTEVTLACAASLGLGVNDTTSGALVLAGAASLPLSARQLLHLMARELLVAHAKGKSAENTMGESAS